MKADIIKSDSSSEIQIKNFENQLKVVLSHYNLPTEGIFVEIPQRQIVFKNLESVVNIIEISQRKTSTYISKFIAAVASGLFDAALNYLWDETILELRKRVSQYDLSYFFDNAVKNSDKRKKLTSEDDLIKIDDSELILGAREIELISDVGYRHLEYIKYMRNWISAAHPNQSSITGLQLISWMETCIKEVISLPLSSVAVEIKKLLSNIKNSILDREDAKEIASFFLNLSQDQVNNLVFGFWGIYTRDSSTNDTRNNINQLLPFIWERVDEETREKLGLKYARYVANSEKKEKKLARQFLDIVDGSQYLTDDLRAIEIENAIDNLLTAHRVSDNFYNEPAFARQLSRLVGKKEVPAKIRVKYVLGVVESFITNGYGVAWNAEPIYIDLIDQFTQKEALIAIISFRNRIVSNMLQFSLCKEKYLELLTKLKKSLTSPAAIEIINSIVKFGASFENLSRDSKLNKRVNNIIKIIKS